MGLRDTAQPGVGRQGPVVRPPPLGRQVGGVDGPPALLGHRDRALSGAQLYGHQGGEVGMGRRGRAFVAAVGGGGHGAAAVGRAPGRVLGEFGEPARRSWSVPRDLGALGEDASGVPVLVRADVTSLLCVPLIPAAGEPVEGVLTLFRSAGRPAFSMAGAQALDLMSRHIALAMGR
ncbi:hypothetical protein ACVHNB_12310 [Streptomyces sp. YJ-C3]